MNAFFASPLAFLTLLAVPALVAIYLFRSRSRIRDVSSLILWEDQQRARQGGLNIDRIQTPLLFVLELLAILMMILGAAGPMVQSNRTTRNFVIILDNSFSMLADDAAPRKQAVKEIRKLLTGGRRGGRFKAHFILAGQTPRVVGEAATTAAQVAGILDSWKCLSPAGDLDAGISLGSELAGKTARVLVVTDHEPETASEHGGIEWWAFGKPQANVAFAHASRTTFEGRDRCLLAAVNLSDKPVRTNLTIESPDGLQLMRQPLALGPRETHRMFYEPETGAERLRARLDDDTLDIDNEAVLVSEPPKQLRVQVTVANEVLRSAVLKALEATKSVRLTSSGPHLLITDSANQTPASFNQWTVQFVSPKESSAYVGPFIMDHSHRLSEGLSLEGIIWGAGKMEKFNGQPLIAAGNVPLVLDKESPTGSHSMTINLNPELSTILQSPNWPILLWNIASWRSSFLPGFSQTNILLGSSVSFVSGPGKEEISLSGPDNSTRRFEEPEEITVLRPDIPGLYTLKKGERQYLLSVNAVSEPESDLTKAAAGKWGNWQEAGVFRWEYKSVNFILLMIALLLLTVHRYFTAPGRRSFGT